VLIAIVISSGLSEGMFSTEVYSPAAELD